MRALAGVLDAWTTDQLLIEVLRRNALDARALRLMHDRTLRARLSARDQEPPAVSH